MSLQPETLNAMIALVLGCEPGKAVTSDLARVLDQTEEVLPWLALRQSAFDHEPAILTRLTALAQAANRPALHRPEGPTLEHTSYALKRDIETALAEMIAANIAQTAHADTIGAKLGACNRMLPGRPGYHFRRRIAEFAPEPAAITATDDIDEGENCA